MRKFILSLLLAASFSTVFAQKIDDVKNDIKNNKWEDARTKIDKLTADPKNQNSSDVWFYQSVVYHNLSKANPADTTLSHTALTGMEKYMDLEKDKPQGQKFLLATLENYKTFFDIYQDYFKNGVKNFQDKNFANAYYSFVGALTAFDYLSRNNVTNVKFDTTSTLYAGFSAQNAKMYPDAAKYYQEMVNTKIADTNYIDAYTFLVSYYLQQKDTAMAQKYLQIGEQTFPQKTDNLWMDYELSMLGGDKEKRLENYESLMKRYPNNLSVSTDYAIELFNYTFTNETKPADYSAREARTKAALENVLSKDPNSSVGNFVMSQYYVNELYDIDDSLRALKGNTPADVAKRKELKTRMGEKYEQMYTYSQKAYDLYSKETAMGTRDKVNYRKTLNQLIDYYTYKKQNDKVAEYQAKLKELQ